MDEMIKARVAEFHKRHGAECYKEGPDGPYWYYPNGAYRDVNTMGLLAEPPSPRTPEGQFQLATNILRFHQGKLNKAVEEYDELNTRLSRHLPADEELALRQLRELKQIVDERKGEVEKAQAALDDTQFMRQRRMRMQAQAEELQRFKDFQKRRQALKV
jgi:hypothetical protein